MRSISKLLFVVCALLCASTAQKEKFVGIKDIAAAGKINSGGYTNSLLGVAIDAPDANLTLNPYIQESAQRGRILQVLSKPTNWDDTYTIALLADLLAVNPLVKTPDDYVRSVRHGFEHQGQPTVREEFPISIGGVRFIVAMTEEHVPNGKKYYHGIYTTFRRGYILSLDVEASAPWKLNELVARQVKFEK